jgi:hypothetical protein
VTAQAIDELFVSSTALRSVNFFNGRLLTGDDLRREQATQEARQQRLGRLVGTGVAEGLEVVETLGTSAKTRPVVTVSAGLAVAPSGAALELTNDLDLALYRDQPPSSAEPGGLFGDCQPFAPGTYTAGAGVYVLTVAPAERGEGRAQVNGLANESAPCNIGLSAEALKFRLIRLALGASELADKEHLRNRIAYACFGAGALAGEVADPFGPPLTGYGLVDTLRTQTMTADEVPLATIGWSIDDGIQFVDLWSVRRRVTRPADTSTWPSLVDDRRRAEGEAMFLQFQQQIRERRDQNLPEDVHVTELFDWLPPAGVLPIESFANGFDVPTFFDGLTTQGPFFIEGTRLGPVLQSSLAYAPIDIASQHDLIWLYEVHENRDATVSGAGLDRPYVLFTSGFIPYAADAQFDLAHWDFANFALDVS